LLQVAVNGASLVNEHGVYQYRHYTTSTAEVKMEKLS